MTLDSGLSAVCRDLSRDESLIRGAEPGRERPTDLEKARDRSSQRGVPSGHCYADQGGVISADFFQHFTLISMPDRFSFKSSGKTGQLRV